MAISHRINDNLYLVQEYVNKDTLTIDTADGPIPCKVEQREIEVKI